MLSSSRVAWFEFHVIWAILQNRTPIEGVLMHKLLEDPVLMRKAQGWITILWVALIPVSLGLGWVKSVTFVSALSLWALVASHGAWWAAASVECKQAEREEEEEDVANEVVEKLVEQTDLKEEPAVA
jgi:hypothetical protein